MLLSTHHTLSADSGSKEKCRRVGRNNKCRNVDMMALSLVGLMASDAFTVSQFWW
jgi:hypothetical protein